MLVMPVLTPLHVEPALLALPVLTALLAQSAPSWA